MPRERTTERAEKPYGARRCRSLIGGALGDHHFAPGDLIPVPADKYDVWLAAGLIEPHRHETSGGDS